MGDLIDRQTAIDALDNYCNEKCEIRDYNWCPDCQYENFKKVLMALPTAQENLQPTCNQLATDCISRQAAIKAIEDLQDCYNGFSDTYDKACIIGVLEELPSAVVRCRNCKHWLQIVENPKHGACDQWCTLNVTTSHDYCSRAERKTDG